MRKLIQILLIVIIAANVPSKIFAQLPKALAFGNFTYADPLGTLSSSYKNGIGFEVGGGIGFGRTLLYASTGYINYNGKNSSIGSIKIVPVKLGIRRYLLFGLFLNGAIGIANQTLQVPINYSGNFNTVNNSGFLYEFGAGLKVFKLIEIGAAYTGWNNNGSNLNALLLKAGLAIKL